MTGPGLTGGFGALRSLDDPALRHNLPSQATSFVGRAGELAELRSLVSGGSRLISIVGPGGIGKSRLALQVAAEVLDGTGDGVWLVELAPVAGPELVARTVAAALAFSLADPDSAEPGLRLAAGLHRFCTMRGHGGEILQALNALLERPDAQMPTRARARALVVSRHLLDYFGHDPAPPSMADEALRIARELADDDVAADALAQLCWLSFEHGDLPAALAEIDDAVGLARAAGDPRLMAYILGRRAVFESEAAIWTPPSLTTRKPSPCHGRPETTTGSPPRWPTSPSTSTRRGSSGRHGRTFRRRARSPTTSATRTSPPACARTWVSSTGATDAQIARRLFLSVNTVRSHLERIRDKTGARRRPELVRYAIQAGIDAIAPSAPR